MVGQDRVEEEIDQLHRGRDLGDERAGGEHRHPHEKREKEEEGVDEEVGQFVAHGELHRLGPVRADHPQVEDAEGGHRGGQLAQPGEYQSVADEAVGHGSVEAQHHQRRGEEGEDHMVDHVDPVERGLGQVVQRPVGDDEDQAQTAVEAQPLPSGRRRNGLSTEAGAGFAATSSPTRAGPGPASTSQWTCQGGSELTV